MSPQLRSTYMVDEVQPVASDAPDSLITEDVTFDDVDALAAAGEGWDQNYVQLSTGKLQAEIAILSMPGFLITSERANRSLWIQARTSGRDFAFGNLGLSDDRARWFGRPLESNTVALLQPSEEVMFRSPCRLDMVHAVVDPDLLSEAAQWFSSHVGIAELSGVQALNADPRLKASLARYLRRVIAGAMAAPSVFAAQAVQADLRAEVIRRFLAVVESAGSHPEPSRPALVRRRRILNAIDTFVREHPDVPLTKLDLCCMANASERTLDYAFKDFYGMAPAAYLKTVRMNAVRRALLESHRDEDTITELAPDFGFWHMGHFARDYKRLFGESPSATLSQRE